ncbi:translation initiation factor IF-2 [Desulfogranum marinum]|uniref:translation initiation factor IF-2 n=1 Tax=Desulfogranum marinum TaxID=453220 RepID=UPI001963D868|nr:translation initiation factor IF-2 [Desulfogranum marinum]MBM9511700.1 translation initiation factor IF-2 [Desulfogranum marinum]
MSRVRVYELAKEAGLKSKELAAKLIAMGYPIKSHSSTVNDDMAADIRRKIKDNAVTGVAEGRIDLKDRSGSSKKKSTTIVRRRSKAQKEEALKQQEEADAVALMEEEAELQKEEMAVDAQPAVTVDAVEETLPSVKEDAESLVSEDAESASDVQVDETVAADVEGGPEVSSGKVSEPAAIDEVKKGEETESDALQPEEVKESDLEQHQASVEEPAAKQVVKPVAGNGNGQPRESRKLAKVIGRVEIPKPAEKKARPPRRPPRPAPVQNKRPGAAVDPAGQAPPPAGKGKKKGKRVVAIQSEDENRAKKTTKGNKRGRGGKVEFSKNGDVEYMRPRKGKRRKDSGRKEKAVQQPVAEAKAIKRRVKVLETISVGDLAKRMGVKANELIAALMKLGVMATLNQALDIDTATLVAADFGYEVEQAMTEELEMEAFQELEEEKGGEAVPRPPVVTVMGHVDHGKTSILDAIRKTDVAEGEAGGITQHIGAYHVQAPSGDLTFVDTPGHAAFTEMRSRGAKVTDIVVLVVAADDGVMDQTKEAIAHSKAAGVPIVVAVNKIDKDNADPERVKRELGEYDLLPEEWGGDTMYCETSAKKGIGINELLEAVQLQAEILELKADPTRKAKGTVIEAQLHKGRGPVATVLVQEGTLRAGDNFVAGMFSGKVRMLINERGENVDEAGPAIPVEVQGISGVPQAGDEFVVLSNEKMAKSLSGSRQLKARESELGSASKVSLDNLFEKMAEQEVKELRVILRADVQGTLQAFGQAAEKLSTSEIKVRVLHEGTGSVTDNDIHLAAASDAIIIGFNVRPSVKVKELAEREQVDVRSYDVIYHALEDIEKAMVGMLDPTFEERVIGTAEVRNTFQVPKVGIVAGCSVIDGKIERNANVRVLRDGVVIYTGKIGSLRRFKDDVKEVLTGFECGIGVENFNDIKLGDNLEAFVLDEIEATL